MPQRFGENLRTLREEAGMRLAQLAEAVSEQGVPMRLNTISRMENGARTADVVELLALAVALGELVSPNRLLLTADNEFEPDRSIALTPERVVAARWAWRWATGGGQLPADDAPVFGERRFPELNHPHDPPDPTTVRELRQWEEHLEGVNREFRRAVRELNVPSRVAVAYVRMLGNFVFQPDDPDVHALADEENSR